MVAPVESFRSFSASRPLTVVRKNAASPATLMAPPIAAPNARAPSVSLA